MIVGDGIVLGAGGESASIFVTGLSEADTVSARKGGKTVAGKWVRKRNPACVLPDGYTQLEHIESTGAQYIKTGFKPNQNSKVEIQYQSASTTQQCIVGCDAGWQVRGFSIYVDYVEFASSSYNPYSTSTKTISILDKGNFYRNGTLKCTLSGSFTSTLDLFVFGQNRSGSISEGLTGKVYYCKIWDNGTIVRDYIPAKRNSDSAIGLYDLVSGTFFSNSGSGTFTAGAEIPQYIDGFEIAPIKSYGTWSVTATDGTKTVAQDVLVDSASEYFIEMDYRLYLYNLGDECTDVTGGWYFEKENGDATPYMTKADSYLDIRTPTSSDGHLKTNNIVSLLGYTKINFEYSYSSNTSNSAFISHIGEKEIMLKSEVKISSPASITFDQERASNFAYVANFGSGYLRIHKIWLE